MDEIFRDIEGYEGLYQISNFGRVKSLERTADNGYCIRTVPERILKQTKNGFGYFFVGLHKGGKVKNVFVHRLVASAFIPNPQGLPQVNHKDECKTNNTVENLEWCDIQYNCNYGTRIKRIVDKQSKSVLCVELNKVFKSAEEARYLGFKPGSIWMCCNGKYNTHKGYHWQYV